MACQNSRRPKTDIFKQFELITKRIDAETEEVVGVKCRYCGEVILDERTAKSLMAHGSLVDPKTPMLGAFSMLAVPLMIWGGMHLLTCSRKDLN